MSSSVFGEKRKEGPIKRTLYFAFYRFLSVIAELRMPLDAGDFCVMDRAVVDVINQTAESRPFIRGLRSWVGFRQSLFPYERAARQAGKTKYSYWKLMKLAADGILSNSRMPLHLATVFGAIVSVVAFLGVILTLSIRMFPAFFRSMGVKYVPGTASIIISLLFVGGVQLLCLGIIGAYVGRIHENVMRRPLWSVRQTLGIERSKLEVSSIPRWNESEPLTPSPLIQRSPVQPGRFRVARPPSSCDSRRRRADARERSRFDCEEHSRRVEQLSKAEAKTR